MPPESCFFASLESLSRLPMDALPQIRHDLALHVDDVETIRGGLPQLVGILKQEFLGAKQLYGVIRNGETGVRPRFLYVERRPCGDDGTVLRAVRSPRIGRA